MDLSARETFELLSAQEIKDKKQIVNILGSLHDKLARDRSEQADRKARHKKSRKTAALGVRLAHPIWSPSVQVAALQKALSPKSRSAKSSPFITSGPLISNRIRTPS